MIILHINTNMLDVSEICDKKLFDVKNSKKRFFQLHGHIKNSLLAYLINISCKYVPFFKEIIKFQQKKKY